MHPTFFRIGWRVDGCGLPKTGAGVRVCLHKSLVGKEEGRVAVSSVTGAADREHMGLGGVELCTSSVSPPLNAAQVFVDDICCPAAIQPVVDDVIECAVVGVVVQFAP